jgi:hypothetical protein
LFYWSEKGLKKKKPKAVYTKILTPPGIHAPLATFSEKPVEFRLLFLRPAHAGVHVLASDTPAPPLAILT